MRACQCFTGNTKVRVTRRWWIISALIVFISVGLGGCLGWRPYNSSTGSVNSAIIWGVVDITAAQCPSDISCRIISTMHGNYYLGSGTSFAAPHVSAAAALLLAAGHNAAEVESLLKSTARPLAGGANSLHVGHGLLDTAYALGVTQGNAPIDTSFALQNGLLRATGGPTTLALESSSVLDAGEQQLLLQAISGKEQALQTWLQQAGIKAHITGSMFALPLSACPKNLGERLLQLGLVESYAVSDVWQAFITDPYFSSQWGLHYTQFPRAWQKVGLNLNNITVAVVDTGVSRTHEDFRFVQFTKGCSMQAGSASTPKNADLNIVFADAPDAADYCYDFDAADENGHGSMVAGIIAADTGNGIGIAGAASGVKLMPVRVLGANGTGNDVGTAYGIWYAAQKGADVINLSLGSNRVSVINPMVKQAIDYAIAKGVVVVAAAGNNGYSNLVSPANYAPVISVGAISPWGTRAYYSNYGPGLDLVAPGGATNADLIPIIFAVEVGSGGARPVGDTWQVAVYGNFKEAGRFNITLPSGVFRVYVWVDANLDNKISDGDYLAESASQLLRAGDEVMGLNLQLRPYNGSSIKLY